MTPNRSDVGRAAVDVRSRRPVPAPVASAPVPGVPVQGAALAPLLGVPGVRYACLADGVSGRRLDQQGDDPGTATAVLEWGLRIAWVSDQRGRELDDLVITSVGAYHLLRPVRTPDAGTVWVYVCAARDRARTRRALTAVLPAVPAPRTPAPRTPALRTPALPARPAPVAMAAMAAPAIAASTSRPGTSPTSSPGPRALRALPSAPLPAPSPAPPPARPVAACIEAPATRMNAPLQQVWRNDLETLRRLLAGLRRLPDPLRGRRTAGDAATRSLPRSTDRSSSSPKEGRHG